MALTNAFEARNFGRDILLTRFQTTRNMSLNPISSCCLQWWRLFWTRSSSALVWMFLGLAIPITAFGQASERSCPPVNERTDEPGPACFTAKQHFGLLPDVPLFWHLFQYPTRSSAEAAKGPRGTVVESFGKVWLFEIADAGWSPSDGKRVAKVGPLPVRPKIEYEAVYMQSIFAPGMTAPLHTHSGPEAFYTLTGETCLETPEGVQFGRGAGHTNIVPGGPPMLLAAIGNEKRRGIVLILHDISQRATTMEHEWKPKGLCNE